MLGLFDYVERICATGCLAAKAFDFVVYLVCRLHTYRDVGKTYAVDAMIRNAGNDAGEARSVRNHMADADVAQTFWPAAKTSGYPRDWTSIFLS